MVFFRLGREWAASFWLLFSLFSYSSKLHLILQSLLWCERDRRHCCLEKTGVKEASACGSLPVSLWQLHFKVSYGKAWWALFSLIFSRPLKYCFEGENGCSDTQNPILRCPLVPQNVWSEQRLHSPAAQASCLSETQLSPHFAWSWVCPNNQLITGIAAGRLQCSSRNRIPEWLCLDEDTF